MQDHAVVHRKRLGRGCPPRGLAYPSFEKRITVGIEQRPAVGGHQQILMSDAAMHRSESGEQASPSVVPPLQHLFAVPVGDLLELLLKRRNGIIVIVKRLAQMQEP